LSLTDTRLKYAALACLNSSLFYWFFTVSSDCRNLNKRELESFPIDLDSLATGQYGAAIEKLATRLMSDIATNSRYRNMRSKQDLLAVQCTFPKLSKPIIDEIDHVLAKYYGFTEEETDYIINYDIKYRMGRGSDDND
jgi:hypothetical protein